MERIGIGIKNLDTLFKGGLIKNSITLVSGVPGTGKTIISLAYIYNGALDHNETGLYVTFEQPVHDLREQALQFGWDLAKQEKKGKIYILSIPIEEIHKETLDLVNQLVKKYKAQRLVIDSLSTLTIAAPHFSDYVNGSVAQPATRFFIYKFISELRKLDCTTLLVSELRHEEWLGKDTTAEFIVDNIILLKYFGARGASSRTLVIKKARKTKFDENIHPFIFSNNGIEIKKPKKVAMPKDL